MDTPADADEQVDVVIVGAGISGIDAAYHLLTRRPGTNFVILEAMDGFGGTWWYHRHPGIRSDSEPVHVRLRVQPVDRSAHRHRR